MEGMKIWTKSSAVKILRDKQYSTEFCKDCTVQIEGARGEYESHQIIITTNEEDVSGYDITIGEVSCGGAVLPQGAFALYNQKYIEVKEHSKNRQHYELGFFPDALLPFDKAIEYHENSVEKGSNQGIWLTVKIPEQQPHGEYHGALTLTVDGQQVNIPVHITVWDIDMPYEVHSKSDFVIGSNGLKLGENNYMPEMYRKYVEKLIEFKLAPHRLILFLNRPYIEAKDYIDELRYLTSPGKPHLSTIMLPVYPDGKGIDVKDYDKYVDALAAACIEDNIDYFARAAVYCGFIDEPHLNNTYELTNAVCRQYEEIKEAAVLRFESTAPDNDFAKQVASSMRKVGNYVTSYFDEKLTAVSNWCPLFEKFATPEMRQKYAAASDSNWWYGCGSRADSPSYTIDHELIDSRVVHWMQREYGLEGSLFWETVMYYKWVWCDKSHHNHETLIDCYSEAARCATDNGDGFLLYPGRPYGIDGPVESIRLHAIRDGQEDYEYLWLYENLCRRNGKDPSLELSGLYKRLYDGVTVKTDCDGLAHIRRELAALILKEQDNG